MASGENEEIPRYRIVIAKAGEHQSSPVLLLNDKVAITYFESSTRQLFETDEGSFVWFKDEEKLVKMSLESFNRLLIKLEQFTSSIENKRIR